MYSDVASNVWNNSPIAEFWGIGSRTKKRLERMGIGAIKQLAQANPDLLRSRMGIIDEQPYHHANGIDPTIISEPAPGTRNKSYGNSQILNRNYYLQNEIEIVIKEIAEQVTVRIQKHQCQTSCIHV